MGKQKMRSIEPKSNGADGFEDYPPNTGYSNTYIFRCDDPDGGGDSDTGGS